jgi:hypothetical protein
MNLAAPMLKHLQNRIIIAYLKEAGLMARLFCLNISGGDHYRSRIIFRVSISLSVLRR